MDEQQCSYIKMRLRFLWSKLRYSIIQLVSVCVLIVYTYIVLHLQYLFLRKPIGAT